MRMMLKIRPNLEIGNAGIQDGSLPKVIQETMEALKPECAYFYPEDGQRTAILVFDMAETSDIPAVVEPLFQQLGATADLIPVMTADELAAGLEKLAR